MQADPLVFFPSANTPRKKPGGLGVNKRNRGYPAGFEFIERPLSTSDSKLTEVSGDARTALSDSCRIVLGWFTVLSPADRIT